MVKSKIIYTDRVTVYAKFDHPKSDDFLEYKTTIQIKNSGKQPITMKLKFDSIYPCFAPMPPELHTIKAKDIIELYLKLERWLRKYGYKIY